MCLIIYGQGDREVRRDVFESAFTDNSDGIGIMVAGEAKRFYGKRCLRRAWSYMQQVNRWGLPFGVHFRFATHGNVDSTNVHPFRAPDSDVLVMHNGVIHHAKPRNGMSDTAAYIYDEMAAAPRVTHEGYYRAIEEDIGYWNKFLVMDDTGEFRILNEWAGDWIAGLWYSQTYSLPDYMQPVRVPYQYSKKTLAKETDSTYEGEYQPAMLYASPSE